MYNDTEKNHFYTCIRSKFSDLFYMLNDRQVKMIDINDIDITPFLALHTHTLGFPQASLAISPHK